MRSFLFFAMLSVFCICGEYAITRPTSNALFLTLFTAKGYPWVWLFTVPLNLFAIYLYNRFLPKIGPLKILWTFALTTVAINTLAALFPCALLLFFQYAWKDIYVLFMLKQVWSMIHTTIPPTKAKLLYSCIYGVGTLGAILGSFVPGFLATTLGSEQILLFTAPVYLLLLFAYTHALQRSKVPETLTPDPRPSEAFSLIRRTPLLIAVLLLVIFMQVSVGLMEYRFNAHLALNILDKDLRTAYCGKLTSLINLLSLALQFLGGLLFIRMLSLRASHFLVPVLLGSSALLSLLFPSFALLSSSYILLKAVDFSLFNVVREMLYVPLQLDAKFRAKAIIDVFAYRTSKALVSLSLLFGQLLAGALLLPMIGYFSLAVFLAWLITIALLFRKSTSIEPMAN